MAWTTPSTWVAGAKLLASQLNEQVRDNENYLKDQIDPIVLKILPSLLYRIGNDTADEWNYGLADDWNSGGTAVYTPPSNTVAIIGVALISNGSYIDVTYPITFAHKPFLLVGQPYVTHFGGYSNDINILNPGNGASGFSHSQTTTGFGLYFYMAGAIGQWSAPWIAIGEPAA